MSTDPNIETRRKVETTGVCSSEHYQLLADARRRAVLTVLDPDGPPVALADLARQVAAHELDSTPDRIVESPRVQRIHVSLYHVHIPKLTEAGVVSYNANRQTVAAGPEFDAVRSLLKKFRTELTK
ncbi:DUF7344 domain-containing protein [Haladaptatus sp. NG-SE-30]